MKHKKLKKKKIAYCIYPCFCSFNHSFFFPDIPRVLLSFWVGKSQVPLLCVSLTLTVLPHSQNFWQQMWGVSPHQAICNTSCMSYNLTQFWHCLPGGNIKFHWLKAQSHKTAPTPLHTNYKSGCHLCFWLISCKSEVPMTPSLCLINLLEWLTELRNTVYLLPTSLL